MSNNKYIIKTFYARQPDGTNKQIKVYGKTEREALQKLAQVQAEYRLGLRTLNNNTPFAQWAREWLEVYKKPHCQPSTYRDTQARLEKYFFPTLGALPLSEIKASHIQHCLNRLGGYSASLQSKALAEINAVFERAVLNDLISKNPVRGAQLPTAAVKQPRRALDAEEIETFKAAAAIHKDGLLFELSLFCGLRPQEARALTRANVDIDKAMLYLTGAVKSKSREIGTTKTAAGQRCIPIPADLLPRLAAALPQDLKPIFRSETGKPLTEKQYYRRWHGFMRQWDITSGAYLFRNQIIIHMVDQAITPYYLRHTYATNLAESGVPIKTAQALLGHSSIAVTANIYTHVTLEMLEEARRLINSKK